MKIYTIIGGVNGVGKSSLTGALSSDHPDFGQIIDTDSITAKNAGDKLKGGKIAIKMLNDALEKGINITQETTLSGVKTLKTIQTARNQNYYIRLYYVGLSSVEDSVDRIANRVRRGGHSISTEDVKRRFDKRFEDLCKILPYCDEVHFYDNENGFAEVGKYHNGKIISMGEYIPKWFKELMEYNC